MRVECLAIVVENSDLVIDIIECSLPSLRSVDVVEVVVAPFKGIGNH